MTIELENQSPELSFLKGVQNVFPDIAHCKSPWMRATFTYRPSVKLSLLCICVLLLHIWIYQCGRASICLSSYGST